MPSTVDGQVGNWTNMIGAEAVAARNQKNHLEPDGLITRDAAGQMVPNQAFFDRFAARRGLSPLDVSGMTAHEAGTAALELLRPSAPSVESLRCVEWGTPEGTHVRVTYDQTFAFVAIETVNDHDDIQCAFSTLVGLLKRYLPPTDEKLSALHRLRLSSTHPVALVCEPEPAAD